MPLSHRLLIVINLLLLLVLYYLPFRPKFMVLQMYSDLVFNSSWFHVIVEVLSIITEL